jgi:segregation and condensation protein B
VRYSRALLETLAIIAYRQPVTRGEIEDIRGVAVSTEIIKTLLGRDWVRQVGTRDVPGHPALYGTTRGFLEHFNLRGLDELPPLIELRDIEKISAELNMRLAVDEEAPARAVAENPVAADERR